MTVRTRFAPSPTGYMHVGNLRTALYAYPKAKSEGGTFILRIEDTDQVRQVEGAVDIIYNTLRQTGLLWDEGPDIGGPVGPYVQSERMGMFKQYAEQLVKAEPTRATAAVRFTLSEERGSVTAIPAGTRVKTEDGKYFNPLQYAEIKAGETWADVVAQAEEAGAGSDGLMAGSIKILVDPIPYIASVSNTTASTGGLDTEDDDSLTRRIYLSPSVYSCAGPRDAYEFYAREWRGDVADVRTDSPEPDKVNIYFVIEDGEGLRLPNDTELAGMKAYMSAETMRPLCDQVECLAPEEVEYSIAFTYWIAESDQKAVSEIQSRVAAAVTDFQTWQRKLGRDINPTELIARLREAGAKRVKLTAPEDIAVDKTELPKCTGTTADYGGLEDD